MTPATAKAAKPAKAAKAEAFRCANEVKQENVLDVTLKAEAKMKTKSKIPNAVKFVAATVGIAVAMNMSVVP